MNSRIKELATEVGISYDYLTNTKQWVLIEKFAELIVQECMKMCDVTEANLLKQGFREESFGAIEAKKCISDRFGDYS